jgi:glutaredoxin
MEPFDPEAYQALAARYTPHMTDRDRDTALPFQRVVTFQTSGSPEAQATLFHVAVADGLWWLLGGFLADPGREILWGWRGWRGEQTLPHHAAALLSTPGSLVPSYPPTLALGGSPSLAAAPTDVVLYTLPYCPDCRAVRETLQARSVPYQEIDVARTPGAVEQMLRLSAGKRSAPTLTIGNRVLVDPDSTTLIAALREAGFR